MNKPALLELLQDNTLPPLFPQPSSLVVVSRTLCLLPLPKPAPSLYFLPHMCKHCPGHSFGTGSWLWLWLWRWHAPAQAVLTSVPGLFHWVPYFSFTQAFIEPRVCVMPWGYSMTKTDKIPSISRLTQESREQRAQQHPVASGVQVSWGIGRGMVGIAPL